MFDDKQFVQDCIRTEAQIEKVEVHPAFFTSVAMMFISVGTMLDQIKKNAFYGKPFKKEELIASFQVIVESLDYAKEAILNIDDENQKAVLDVNTRLFHSIVGIATESSELMEALLNAIIDGVDLDSINVAEEFGDLGWYQALGLDELGLEMGAVFLMIIKKLKARYPDKFTSEAAINRNLEVERSILEEGC